MPSRVREAGSGTTADDDCTSNAASPNAESLGLPLLLVMTMRTNAADVGAKVKTSGRTATTGPVLGLALKMPSKVGLLNAALSSASKSKPRTLLLKLFPKFHRAKDWMVNVPPRSKSKLPVRVPMADAQTFA